jgi:hypothetical protein
MMMSEYNETPEEKQELIEQLILLVLPRLQEFDTVWESANRVCDRYYTPHAA